MFRFLKESLLNLIYPPVCLHCHQMVLSDHFFSYYCQSCIETLSLLDPATRCPLCVSSNYDLKMAFCFDCKGKKKVFDGVFSCFDGDPVAISLKNHLDKTQDYQLIASYMVASFFKLNWDIPSVVFSTEKASLVAYHFSKMLNINDQIKKRWVDYILKKDHFFLSRNLVFNKTVLVLGMQLEKDGQMQALGRKLQEKGPLKVYGLTFL